MSVWAVIGGLITLAIMLVKWRLDNSTNKKAKQDAQDKAIDSASDADDIMRQSGLRT